MESKKIYAVIINRRALEPIFVIESEDYDKCYSTWEVLLQQWETCVKELKPFVLREPVVTAFEPGLIFGIDLLPIQTEDSKSNAHNPYARKMKQEGFSQTFRNFTQNNILDGGYSS